MNTKFIRQKFYKIAALVLLVFAFFHGYTQEANYNSRNSNSDAPDALCPINYYECSGITYDFAKGVVMIKYAKPNGVMSGGTGILVNNNIKDGKAYVLTAAHIIGDPIKVYTGGCPGIISDAEINWFENHAIFYFNNQNTSPGCISPDGDESQRTYGCKVVKVANGYCIYGNNHKAQDMVLLELNSNPALPPYNFNVYFSGWKNQETDLSKPVIMLNHSGVYPMSLARAPHTELLNNEGIPMLKINDFDFPVSGGASGAGLVIQDDNPNPYNPWDSYFVATYSQQFDESCTISNGDVGSTRENYFTQLYTTFDSFRKYLDPQGELNSSGQCPGMSSDEMLHVFSKPGDIHFPMIRIGQSTIIPITVQGRDLSGDLWLKSFNNTFLLSLSPDGDFTWLLDIPLVPGSTSIPPTTVYVKFSPLEAKQYTGRILVHGGYWGNHQYYLGKYVYVDGSGGDPTCVTLSSFSGTNKDINVNRLDWETASEIGTAGFYLRRSADSVPSHSVRCSDFIMSKALESGGATYTTNDTLGEYLSKSYYWLEEIETDNDSKYYGPISVITGAHLQVCKNYSLSSTFQTLAFNQGIWGDAVCFSSAGTSNQADPVGVRIVSTSNTTTSGSATMFLEEEQSLDTEVLHPAETIGLMGWNTGMIYDSANRAIGECGKIAVSNLSGGGVIPDTLLDNVPGGNTYKNQYKTVLLKKSYTDAIVIMQLGTRNDPAFCHTQVSSVSGNRLTFLLEEWRYMDGYHAEEICNYLVIEKGNHKLMNGIKVRANRGMAGSTAVNISFSPAFSAAPVVVHNTGSFNITSSFVSRGTSPVTASGMMVKMQEQESSTYVHPPESIHYLATDYPLANGIHITVQPVNATVTGNGEGAFSCIATSVLPLRYRWEVSTNGGSSWTPIIVSGTAPVYYGYGKGLLRLSGVPMTANGYMYRCCISNLSNKVYTSVASLQVVNPPMFKITGTTDPNGSENEKSEIKAFPNPFTNGFAIQYTVDEATNVKIAILDMQGRIIRETEDQVEPGTHLKAITELPGKAGLYFYKVIYTTHGQMQQYSGKVVKM
jgi:hypothetical protein